MAELEHPNLLKIIDADPDSKWFVSQFHPKGTLNNNKERFVGNFEAALKAFRPLVEGVSEIHKKSLVHRDIKPQNVFIDSNERLVLGDFGLVFFTDQEHTRYSPTFENVGSRDWMPGWAYTMRIDEVRPTFDMFCLGKLLWSMISNIPLLPLWYFDRPDKPQFNLEEMFPDAPFIKLANPLLKKCIVEDEQDCLPDATALLEEVDRTLSIISLRGDRIGNDIERRCKVCGIGKYNIFADQNENDIRHFGLAPGLRGSFKIFTCNHCGHAQLFKIGDKKTTPAWFSNE
jgi:serine/threonine protein kinase